MSTNSPDSGKPKRRCVRRVFATRFQAWRAQSGIPLKTVASQLGVGITTVSQWEHGARFPIAENLDAIEQYTGIPCCRFFCPGPKACDQCSL